MLKILPKIEPQPDQFTRLMPDALSMDLCEQIIEQFEADSRLHYIGEVSDGLYLDFKNATNLCINRSIREGSEIWKDIDDSLCAIVSKTWDEYLYSVEMLDIVHAPFSDAGYLVQKYTKGKGFFKPHADSASFILSKRVAGCIMYLNDVAVGGETNFPRQGFKVAPCAGSLIWFPASYPHVHEGLIPISDDKYIITAFMEFSE